MRYLGLDLGTKTLGVAVSDKTGLIATSLTILRHDNDYDFLGGNKKAVANAELLFPLPGIKDQRSVRLSLFADAGSIWDGNTYQRQNGGSYTSSFSEEMRYSAGAAFTWLSPMGPLKFSYAYPLNNKDSDELQRFQFQLGTTF